MGSPLNDKPAPTKREATPESAMKNNTMINSKKASPVMPESVSDGRTVIRPEKAPIIKPIIAGMAFSAKINL